MKTWLKYTWLLIKNWLKRVAVKILPVLKDKLKQEAVSAVMDILDKKATGAGACDSLLNEAFLNNLDQKQPDEDNDGLVDDVDWVDADTEDVKNTIKQGLIDSREEPKIIIVSK
jgi:hypothetical protein